MTPLSVWRLLPVKTWLIIGAGIAVLAIGLAIYSAGRGDERDAAAVRQQKAEARAGVGRETAGTERQIDTTAITARQKERDGAAEQLPDGVPDDRERRRRCRQLRDAGVDVAECRGSAG